MSEKSKRNIESLYGLTFDEYQSEKKVDSSFQFQFAPFFNDQRKYLKGLGKFLFYFFLFGYMIAPLIIVPILSYKFDNWYLLFGILFSYLSTYFAMRKKHWPWAAPLLFMFWYWYKHGFYLYDYINFYWLCLLWGGWTYSLCFGYEEEFAKVSIEKDRDLFNNLSQRGIIFFMRKTEEPVEYNANLYLLMGQSEIARSGNYETAITYFDKAIVTTYNYSQLHLNRGFANIELKNFEDALGDFETVINLAPLNGAGYYGRAFCYHKLADTTMAENDYKKAKKLGVKNLDDVLKNLRNYSAPN